MILMKEKALSRLILLLPNYFYQNEEECERQFTNNQHFGHYKDWIKFFLQGIITSSELAIRKINMADVLREENLRKILALKKSALVLNGLCDYLMQKPLVSVQEISDVLHISYNTATKYVKMMEE